METAVTIKADLNDILFEDRNKAYGAYQLRQNYTRYLMRAASMSLLLFLLGTSVPKFISWFREQPVIVVEPEEDVIGCRLITMDNLDLTTVRVLPLIEPEKKTDPVKTTKVVVPVPYRNVDEKVTMTELEKIEGNIGTEDVEGKDGPIDWDKFENVGNHASDLEETDTEPDPMSFVDLQYEPRPINMDEFTKRIANARSVEQGGYEGEVVLRVLLDKNGFYEKHLVVKETDPELTAAVTAQLSHLRFTPGIQAGKPVRVWVVLPVKFRLN